MAKDGSSGAEIQKLRSVGGDVEDQNPGGDQAVDAAAVDACLDLPYAGQRRVAQLAQQRPVSRGVQDAAMPGVGQEQAAGAIWSDPAQDCWPAVRWAYLRWQLVALAVEPPQGPIVRAHVHKVLLADDLDRSFKSQARRLSIIQYDSRRIDHALTLQRVLEQPTRATVEHIEVPVIVRAESAEFAPRRASL